MADDSTTETIGAAVDGSYTINSAGGVSYDSSGPTTGSISYVTSFNVTRAALQFVWPNTLVKSDIGSLLYPPVLASSSITLSAETLIGTPKVSFWLAVTSEVTLDNTIWPGPLFDPSFGAPTPDSSLTVYDYIDLTPTVNGDREPALVTIGPTSYTLDAGQLSRAFVGQPGVTAWDLNFTIIVVLSDELDGFPAARGSPKSSVAFSSLEAMAVTDHPFLTVEHVDFHTGFMTHVEPGAATRAVRDGRFGIPSMSAELVPDRYLLGIWVRPDQQDPDDGVVHYPKRPEKRTDDKSVR